MEQVIYWKQSKKKFWKDPAVKKVKNGETLLNDIFDQEMKMPLIGMNVDQKDSNAHVSVMNK